MPLSCAFVPTESGITCPAIVSSANAAQRPSPSVFLSYASEDRRSARALRDALAGHGLEVWYDESELGGGDAWDQRIRRQIRECDYFMPVISAQTEARAEGYFRREWRLAVERTLDMADDHPFLLPIVIDQTDQAGARVPEKFLAVQWLRIPGGQPTAALEALCRRVAAGGLTAVPPARKSPTRSARAGTSPMPVEYPAYPKAEPGHGIAFAARAAAWAGQCAWIAFGRLPRWVRLLAYTWLAIVLLSKGCTPHHSKTADYIPPGVTGQAERVEVNCSTGLKAGGFVDTAQAGCGRPAADSRPHTTLKLSSGTSGF